MSGPPLGDVAAGTVVIGAAESAAGLPSSLLHEATATVRDEVQEVARGGALPFDGETYIRANAAVQVGAGILLASGRLPRLSSAALAATLVPTTLAHHRFWEAEGEERRVHLIEFQKNLSLIGGLLLAAADTEGRPGLRWRADHAGDQARLVTGGIAEKASALASAGAHQVQRLAADAADRLPINT